MVPVVGAWGADDRMWLWYRRDPRDTEGLEPARLGDSGAPLMRGASCVSFLSLDRSSLVV